jgi:hypothetical protein
LQRELPPVGSDIITGSGRARVLAQEILAGQVLIETEDGRRIVIDAADVLTVLKRERKPSTADAPLAEADELSEELTTEALPPDLAQLEDTVFRDTKLRQDSSEHDNGTFSDVDGTQ